MLRWIERDGERVLQECVGVDMCGGNCWKDVPTGKEGPNKKSLAYRLHKNRHTAIGMSEKDAGENWNQHSAESQKNVWGEITSEWWEE